MKECMIEWKYANEMSNFQWKYAAVGDDDCPDIKVLGPTWGPPGADRTQVGPMNFVIWVSEHVRDPEYEDELIGDIVNVSRISECELLSTNVWVSGWVINEWICYGSNKTEILCIYTSNCQVACITASSIDNMYGYTDIDFIN